MDQLPRAIPAPSSRDRIRFGAQDGRDRPVDARRVRALPRPPAGRMRRFDADYAIITVPFPVLRHVEVLKPFSHPKRARSASSTTTRRRRSCSSVRRRFWEEDDGIFGGGTRHRPRDPQHLLPGPAGARDGARRAARELHVGRGRAALGLAVARRPHRAGARERRAASIRRSAEEFEVGASKMWHDDEFAGGAFALFDPGQQTLLYEPSSRRRGASTSPASTRRSATRGSRARSSRACAPRSKSTRWAGRERPHRSELQVVTSDKQQRRCRTNAVFDGRRAGC